MSNELTVHDIECKIVEKIEQYEKEGKTNMANELTLLLGWILCDDEY